MIFKSILIANRGEIAIRIARAAGDLGARAVMVFAENDETSLHVKAGDAAAALPGSGARAYLDIEAVVEAARRAGCDAVHPGYGFLSESAAFARACAAAGLTFIGPSPEALDALGDKARARALAVRAGVPVIAGSAGPVSVDEARAFFDEPAGGVGDDDQGGRRRRRPGHADHPRRRRDRGGPRLGGAGGGGGVRPGRALRRAADGAGAAHRGPGRRRPHRGAGDRRARLFGSAPAPEDPRDRPGAQPVRRHARPAVRRRRHPGGGGPVPHHRHHRVPARPERRGLRLHRGQSPAAGGAHRHRGGHRRRSGPDPDPPRRRREPGLPRTGGHARTPRGVRRSGPGQSGDPVRRRRGRAHRRGDHGL